jgi:hypothetical protein
MNRYRKRLPQLGQSVFLTGAGLENTVSLQDGMDVPMVNEQTMLHKYALLQQLPDVPASIQSHYAEVLTLARRADQLARQCEHTKSEMHSSAVSLDSAMERVWSQMELAIARTAKSKR